MKAREIMTSRAITVRQDATLEEAANLMTEKGVGGLPVVDDPGDLVGSITDSDLAAKQRGVPFSLIRAPQVLGQWIGNEGLEQLVVLVRGGRPIGIVARHDLLRLLLRKGLPASA